MLFKRQSSKKKKKKNKASPGCGPDMGVCVPRDDPLLEGLYLSDSGWGLRLRRGYKPWVCWGPRGGPWASDEMLSQSRC